MRITVNGTSRIKVPAEIAQITFAISRRNTDHEAVIHELSAVAMQVRTLLDELTPDDDADEPHLSGLRTWTDFTTDGEPVHVAHLDGWVTVWELEDMGEFLSRLATVEGVSVDHIEWKLTPYTRDATEPEAIRDAFLDARQRARWIASAAGRENLEVISINDGGAPPSHRLQQAHLRADSPAHIDLDLDPVDVEVTVTLTVEFDTSPA